MPCYYLSALLIFFCVALPSGAYWSAGSAVRDLLATLTFTQTFSVETYLGTHINVECCGPRRWRCSSTCSFPLLARAVHAPAAC